MNGSRIRIILVIILSVVSTACAEMGFPTEPAPAPTAAPVRTERPSPTAVPSATSSATAVPTATPSPTGTATSTTRVAYAAGDYVDTIESGGRTRRYRLHVPPGYELGKALPLVINLHGLGSNTLEQAILSGTSALADASARTDGEGFLVVYPQGRDVPRMWHGEPSAAGREDVQFIRDLVAHLQEALSIDADRIYATGMSNGGGMAHRLACDLSDTIAAIGPVSGAYLLDTTCTPERPVPVVAFHGTADRIVPYEGQGRSLPGVRAWAARWAARNGCGEEPAVILEQGDVTAEAWGGCDQGADVVLYTVHGGGHNWPGTDVTALGAATQDVDATDVIWAFFEAHPRRGRMEG